jgi:alkylation response protein AidB-like acyl-CoA dehydrogenase
MKAEWLPKLAKGEILMAFGVTEPTAGVDTSRIKTRAEKVDGGWVVNGQKVWITNAQNAHKILLLARTSPRRDDKPLHGMSLFFTDLDRSRITVREIEKLGRAAIDSNELFIDNLEVSDDELVGEVDQCGEVAATAKFLGAEAGFEACDRAMSTLGGYA